MGVIEDTYADLDTDVSEEEFSEAVESKIEQMGGLADEETAAMLVAHELDEGEVDGIADIEPGMEEVKFLGKVRRVGEVRTFDRDDDSEGQVLNVEVADETGAVRIALWDEQAASAAEELAAGQVLRVKGRPKEGYNGLEVSVDQVEPDEDVEIDVPEEEDSIEALALGRSDVTVDGVVLDTGTVRTFDRDDGSEGQVRNVRVQDSSGDIRVALWSEKADKEIGPGDEVTFTDVEIQDGWREDLEASAGWRSSIVLASANPETDPASDAGRNGGTEAGAESADTTTEGETSGGLSAFADGTAPESNSAADAEATGMDAEDASDDAGTEVGASEGFTGTVVQAGSPVILDDGERTIRFETGNDVGLGETVTVRGRSTESGFELDELETHDRS